MKEKLLKRIGFGGGILFWITAVVTVIYWVMIVGQFLGGEEFAKVPAALNEIYLTMLFSYVGLNLTEKACKKNNGNKRPGSIFVVGWLALVVLMSFLVSFHIYGEEEDLSLLWPSPFMGILLIYGGSQALKNVKGLLKELKEVFKTPSES